ncbi:hypothetical protein [Haloferax sp. KTX1]|nr:hypothetical protein [Haloferax sp. KTX1]
MDTRSTQDSCLRRLKMYHATIDPDARTLTLTERRPDPITGEEREVTINTYQLNGSPLETDFVTRSISESEDGKIHLELEADAITDLASPRADFWDEVAATLGIEYRHGNVRLNDEKSAAQNYRDFVRFLAERDYLTTEDLPIALPSATNRYIVNNAPYHQDGSEMTREEEVAEDVYIDVNASADTIGRHIKALSEQLVPA